MNGNGLGEVNGVNGFLHHSCMRHTWTSQKGCARAQPPILIPENISFPSIPNQQIGMFLDHKSPNMTPSTEARTQHGTRRCRTKLTGDDVIKIFELKQRSGQANKVASMYGVSEKAIRDIWTARTWAKETWHLEPSRALVIKQAGRPRGSKDSKPRKMKASPPLRASIASCSEIQQHELWVEDCEVLFGEEPVDFELVGPAEPVLMLQDGSGLLSVHVEEQSPSLCQEALQPFLGIMVDEQLSEWNADIWCNPQTPDPFELDWQLSKDVLQNICTMG